MSDIGNDFTTFLQVYYPEDYNKVSRDNVTDSVITAVINEHKERFNNWLKVPESIRREYFGRVPDEILNAAKTDNNLTIEECRDIENKRGIPEPSEHLASEAARAVIFTAATYQAIQKHAKSIMEKGYSEQASVLLATNSATRDELSKLAEKAVITLEAMNEAWIETRESDKKTIKKDWVEHAPEKMLVHIAKEMDRGHLDKETALPQMFELAKAIKEQNRESELETYLQKPSSRFSKWNEENRTLFNELMFSHDIGTIAQSMNKVRSMSKKQDITKTSTNRVQTNKFANRNPSQLRKNIAENMGR